MNCEDDRMSETVRRVGSVVELEALIGVPPGPVLLKEVHALDAGCRAVLAHSPVAALGHRDGTGVARTSIVGGAPGFAQVRSSTRVAVPTPGPHLPVGPVSSFFLLPGVGEVLRLNGTVVGHRGGLTEVEVQQAFVHCAQAVLRADLWRSVSDSHSCDAPTLRSGSGPVIRGDGPLLAPGVADFLAGTSFLALSTWDAEGGCDTSPRGEAGPVLRILDARTLLLPDRRGNRRADALHNLLQDDRISMAALIPGRAGVLQLRGRATITDQQDLLAPAALRGLPPHAALLIDVEAAWLEDSPALRRSRLWDPSARPAPGQVPDLMALGGQHAAANLAAGHGGPLTGALRAVMALPGMTRVIRLVMNRAYRVGLRREGYADPEPASARSAGSGPGRFGPGRSGLGGSDSGTPGSGESGLGRTAVGTAGSVRRVRLVELRPQAPGVLTLVLVDAEQSSAPFGFAPGQFFTLVADVAGRQVRRAYSASSAPGSDRLELTVKRIAGGELSGHVHTGLRVGDELGLHGPSGSFRLPDPAAQEVTLIAAGSGVTPMMSMIRARLSAPERFGGGTTTLLYSTRTEADMIYAAELAEAAARHPDRFALTHVPTARVGRLDGPAVRAWIDGQAPGPDRHYYVCGPTPLMDVVQDVVAGLGVPATRFHREQFTATARPAAATTGPAQRMRLLRDGGRAGSALVEPGQTLLDAGLAAGLAMPYSCTVGSCGQCRMRLVDGQVAATGPGCLSPQQEAQGYVLTCVSVPVTPVALEVYPCEG